MRNLKKVLALVLALVMSLSLVTIANAADFSDSADINYDEAVDVMVAAGIIDGVGNNSFDPNGTLTREQAAKLITYMLLGENSEKLGVEGTSFKDVAATRWSAPAIEYCASLGIIDGAGDGNFYPAGKLTGYAFAKMLLTALGYDSQIEKFVGNGWTIPVATIGMDVGLHEGLENMFGNAEITRQEAAQMALNAIKAPLVEYPNKGSSVSVNGVVVDFTAKQYEYITTTIARTQTISTQKLSNSDKYTIEFGEKYLPKLELHKETNDFGQPAYTWAYDKKEIGTYMDDTDLVAEFTTKVTGGDLYDAITKNVIDHLDNFVVTIDGEEDDTVNEKIFASSAVKRNADATLGDTEKGVLTQVFVTNVNHDAGTRYDVKIVIINTYLAIATEDYDSKNEEVDLEIYAIDNFGSTKNPDYIKLTSQEKDKATVKNVDINVEDVKEDEIYLVTVANGKVQTMTAPEIVSNASIDSFKLHKDVTVEGKTYEYASTAKYDIDVLDDYSKTNLKDTTYNVILDQYGYLIGIEQNEDPDQYVFLAGLDGNYSYLSTKNADANVIFMDGRMETVTVNVAKSQPIQNGKYVEGGDWTDTDGDGDSDVDKNHSQINTWCTYSVNSAGVYTLKEVATTTTGKPKVMQKAENASSEIKIDKKNVTLSGISGKVYGNDNTVYINVELKEVRTKTATNPWYFVIDDVDSVTTGAKNASLVINNKTTKGGAGAGSDSDHAIVPTNEVYTLYKDNGYIIAAVVIGEDDGANEVYAYVHSDKVSREKYSKADDEWTWTREAIVDGKIVELTEVGGGTDLSVLKAMEQGAWYELKLKADGDVKSAELIEVDTGAGAAPTTGTPHSNQSTSTDNANDYVFCIDYTKHIGGGDYPKFIGKVDFVREAVKDNDTVILHQTLTAPAAKKGDMITYKDGTLYVNTNGVKGFDVSPEVKTVLCTSDGDGNEFDDVDDSFTGYNGLESAIRNLDSNFTGDLSVIFDKGTAVVVIFNDTTLDDGSEDNELDPGVEIEGKVVTITYEGEEPNDATIIGHIAAALKSEGYDAGKITLTKGSPNTAGNTGKYVAEVTVNGVSTADVDSDYILVNTMVNDDSLDKLVESIEEDAGRPEGADPFQFTGEIIPDGNTITLKSNGGYGNSGDKGIALMNDVNRLLAGFHDSMDVNAIKFDGTGYKWDDAAQHEDNNGNMVDVKGSKWHSGTRYDAAAATSNTLVHDLTEALGTAISNGTALDGLTFVLTLDGVDYTIKIVNS